MQESNATPIAGSDGSLQISLRAPASNTSFTPPTMSFISGTWHVTHSTLPMWSKNRNVRITYTALPSIGDNTSSSPKLNDLVEYQSLTDDRLKTIEGIDTPASNGTWDWRGKGWLMIASSHWEILGYGTHEGQSWMVTYFAKTLFTPAGLDVYSRSKEGLSRELLARILDAIAVNQHAGVQKLAKEIFVVKSDYY